MLRATVGTASHMLIPISEQEVRRTLFHSGADTGVT